MVKSTVEQKGLAACKLTRRKNVEKIEDIYNRIFRTIDGLDGKEHVALRLTEIEWYTYTAQQPQAPFVPASPLS